MKSHEHSGIIFICPGELSSIFKTFNCISDGVEDCDVPNKAQLDGKLDQLFRNLPKEYLIHIMRTELLPGAIVLEAGTVSRLDEFRPDRPCKTFCRGNDTVTLFSIYSKYPIRMTIPWRLCWGHNGTMVSSVDRVRYEGELVVTKTHAGTQSKITNLMPVVMDSINVGMTGAEDTMNIIVHMLGEHCDVPDKTQLEDKLDKLIRNLPKEHVANQTKTEILPRAIFLGEGTLYGLDLLKQDRPYKTFCRGKDTVTVFSVSARYSMRMHIPWSLCSGQNGTFLSNAQLVRFEGELVTTKTDSGTEYRIKNVIPVVLEGVYIGLNGGGDIVSTIASALSFILSGLVR
ncbi:hypothetical protein HPB47_014369, partial [Ixodes persulcatus]